MVLINKTGLGYTLRTGAGMPAFSLPGTDGATHTSDEYAGGVAVIAFWCNHCPYVHAAERQFEELVRDFPRVRFVCISSNDAENYPEDSFARMQEKDVPYTYLYDETQEVARSFGAECTPHVFVFRDGLLVYQGRVDDAGQGSPTTHDLRDALEDLAAGREVAVPETPAMGCSIKWK